MMGSRRPSGPPIERRLAHENRIHRRRAARGHARVRHRDLSSFEVKATKDGKRVEAYVNPANAAIVEERVKWRS
jgi:hypothetical protein